MSSRATYIVMLPPVDTNHWRTAAAERGTRVNGCITEKHAGGPERKLLLLMC